uniref:G_PROTEIN_RECEP_F1_2 domain-containing protein n=1 Tax=Caenorhabditis tropicalis TaxID=1561998 RepID=A0A1I7V2H5_9PELO
MSIGLLYPLLTILLYFEIRKSSKLTTRCISQKKLNDRHRPTRMILIMTIFYVIYSTPSGLIDFIQIFVKDNTNVILKTLVDYGSVFLSMLFCLNSMSHSVINFAMSSKYRQTCKKLLRIKNKLSVVLVSKS